MGNVNVMVDALSRKAHCNSLPTICLAGVQPSIQILPNRAQYNMTSTTITRGDHRPKEGRCHDIKY
jgi:hypothetical protein